MSKDAAQPEPVPSTTYERLAEQFPVSAHKTVKKGGREQTYIPWTDKVERFNDVLGHNWSFRVIREGLTDTEAWVLGELSVTIDGVTTVRQQYGCESITRGQNASPVTDLFKIAGTDALSKAATLFGCGLYLSIQEERAEVEAAMREAVREAVAAQRASASPKAATASTSSARTTAPSTTADAPAETPLLRWERLVAEAESVTLPTLGAVKAVDPRVLNAAQLTAYANKLERSIATFRGQQGAA